MTTKEGDGLEHEASGNHGIRDLSELAGADTLVDVLTQLCEQAAPHVDEEEREEFGDVEEARALSHSHLDSKHARGATGYFDDEATWLHLDA